MKIQRFLGNHLWGMWGKDAISQNHSFRLWGISLILVISLFTTIMGRQAAGLSLLAQPHAPQSGLLPGAEQQNIEFVQQFGGVIDSAVVQDNYVYMNVGPRLVILDISTPETPVVVGQSAPLAASFIDIVVQGDKTYVLSQGFSANDGGLHVFDTSDVTRPVEVGTIGGLGWSQRLFVDGAYAYITGDSWGGPDDGLTIIDVTSPQEMKKVSYTVIPGIRDVVVVGQLAYVVFSYPELGEGLYIFDVSQPATPHLIGSLVMSIASDIAVQNGFAYVTTYHPELNEAFYLDVVDISDPMNPHMGDSWGPVRSYSTVEVTGDHVYVWTDDESSSHLEILDISTPTNPTAVGSIPISWPLVDYDFFAHEDTVVLTEIGGIGGSRERLHLVDVSVPTAPHEVGVFESPLGRANLTALNPPYSYVVSRDTLEILNTANLTAPVHLNSHLIADDLNITDLAFHQNHVYLTRWPYLNELGDLRIVDVSDPTAPIDVSIIPIARPSSVDVVGQTAYVTDVGDPLTQAMYALHIFDVSNPASPVSLGSYSFGWQDHPNDVVVRDEIAYLVSGQFSALSTEKLQILDVSDPASPQVLATQELPTYPYNIVLQHNYAYIAANSYLHIFDITEPDNPIEVNRLTIGPYGLAANGSFLFVTSTTHAGVDMIDISNPADPLLIEKIDTYGTTYNGFATITPGLENEVYISLRDEGVLVLQPHLAEQITATVPSASRAFSTTITGADIEIVLPTGTFSPTTAVTYNRLAHDAATGGWTGVGFIFDLTAVVSDTIQLTQSNQPFTITVHYPPGPAIEETLNLYRWNGNDWEPAPGSILDMTADTITVSAHSFGVWAILGESHRSYLTTILR